MFEASQMTYIHRSMEMAYELVKLYGARGMVYIDSRLHMYEAK